MDLNLFMWILFGGFSWTWGICIFFMIQSNNTSKHIRDEMLEIRKEISSLYYCVKDHHARISVIEKK